MVGTPVLHFNIFPPYMISIYEMQIALSVIMVPNIVINTLNGVPTTQEFHSYTD